MFSGMRADTISIRKQTGEVISGIKASVQRTKIFLDSGNFTIDPGDTIERHMSNGGIEKFEVIDPNFYESQLGFPAHYQMTVRKLGIPTISKSESKPVYNINGNNNRILLHSTDNSHNAVSITNDELLSLLNDLRQKVQVSNLSEEQKITTIDHVDAIQEHVDSGNPKRSIIKTIAGALPMVDNAIETVKKIQEFFN